MPWVHRNNVCGHCPQNHMNIPNDFNSFDVCIRSYFSISDTNAFLYGGIRHVNVGYEELNSWSWYKLLYLEV